MTPAQRQKILDQLEEARLLLEGILRNPDIAARLATFGVDKADANEGERLYTAANDSVTGQDRLQAEQWSATATVETLTAETYSAYTLVSEVARAATGNDKTRLALLGIVGKTPQSVSGLLARGKALLDAASAHPELASLLAKHGQDAAALAVLKTKFDALASADAAQQSAKGAAQRATATQTDALKELGAWVGKVKRLARAAFRGDKQQLEKLGLVAR